MSTSSSPELVTLSDVQVSLSLFAEAIAGHPVSFEAVDDPHQCWPHVVSRVEADAIRLPKELPTRGAFRAAVLQHVLVAPCPATPPAVNPLDYASVYAMVEDHRVHFQTRDRFPGAVGDQLATLARASLPSAGMSVLAALRCYSVRGEGSAPVSDLVEAAITVLDEVATVDATAEQSATTAHALLLLVQGHAAGLRVDEIMGEIEANEDEPALPSEGPTSVSLDGGTPTEFAESDGLGGGNLLGDGDEQIPTVSHDDDADSPRLGLQLPAMAGSARGESELRTFLYDEWDYHEQRYLAAWCRVIEESLVGEDHGFITDVRTRHQALRSRIRRSFLKLRSQEYVRVYRSDDGDELDLDAAIEAIADRRSGAPADERLHIRRDRAARDVATAFLVDLSASTSSPAVPPEPEPVPETDPMDDPMSYGPIWATPPRSEPVRRVIDVAKDAVALMGEALHELGDHHAIYGFSGTGREAVEFKIGKDFADRVTPASWAAVAAMKPLRYTRMGPAVRHAAAKLSAESAKTKLLIIVSDGYPQDTDYGRDRHDRDYGIHDTGRALADANVAGIETFCVTIDPAGHDYLRTMCPDHRYLVIDDVESLPEELAKLYVGRFHTVGRVDDAPHR